MLLVEAGRFSSRDSTMQSTMTVSMGVMIRRNQGHVGTCQIQCPEFRISSVPVYATVVKATSPCVIRSIILCSQSQHIYLGIETASLV